MMAEEVDKKLTGIIGVLTELQNDITVPRNVKDRLQKCVNALQEETELSLRTDKAMQALDELSSDANLQAYTRTQIWNVASMLEKL